jgi:hypothetical protein
MRSRSSSGGGSLTSWVWVAFLSNAVVGLIFAFLCLATYQEFAGLVTDTGKGRPELPQGIKASTWQSLFRGAAVSAALALTLVVLFNALAAFLLLCSTRSLSHPGRRFGRAFTLAAAGWTGLHVLNIALQFQSFTALMGAWRSDMHANFNTSLLRSCVAFGYVSALGHMVVAGLLAAWREGSGAEEEDAYSPLRVSRTAFPAGISSV